MTAQSPDTPSRDSKSLDSETLTLTSTPHPPTTQDNMTFTCFPNLPVELRRKVWKINVLDDAGPRDVEITFKQHRAANPAYKPRVKFTKEEIRKQLKEGLPPRETALPEFIDRWEIRSPTPAPAIVNICSESREVGMERYVLAVTLPSKPGHEPVKKIWVDPLLDTIIVHFPKLLDEAVQKAIGLPHAFVFSNYQVPASECYSKIAPWINSNHRLSRFSVYNRWLTANREFRETKDLVLLVEVVGDGIEFQGWKPERRVMHMQDRDIDKPLMALGRRGISGTYIDYLEVLGDAWDKMCGMAEL